MREKFELKVGEMVQFEDGNIARVVPNGEYGNGLAVSGETEWYPARYLDENGQYAGSQIIKVYSRTTNVEAWKHSIKDRKVVWEYKDPIEPEELTLEDITERLGYNVKIVK